LDQDGSDIDKFSAAVVDQWSASVHAEAQVNCSGCHDSTNWPTEAGDRELDIAIDSCASCHERQFEGFKGGLHGMRIKAKMAPMKVQDARLNMHSQARHRSLTCASCHDPHQPDLKRAAVDACLECHDDTHSRNYQASAHSTLWKGELAGELPPGSGVSCASCHMPRIKKGKLVFVEHNQSQTLEPNSKMIRPVCLHCHGLEFSVAALTDRQLIDENFARPINTEHPSFVLVRKRLAKKTARETN
jgi:formate-dependent nitrite reductase cytochrome c552 subunit